MSAADEVLAALTGSGAELRQGVVTQVSPLLVRVGAATTAAPATALSSYVPIVADVVSVLEQDGDRLVLGATTTTAWQTPTLTNSWVNHGGTSRTARYGRDGAFVVIEATIKDGTLNAVAWVLDADCRPPQTVRFGSPDGAVQIDASGNVTVYGASNTIFSVMARFSTI